MNSKTQSLDKAFIQKQSNRLNVIRQELIELARGGEVEEGAINAQSSGEAQEAEDDAQRLATLEVEQALVVRNRERLAAVERALQKIADGTYGLSDETGQPIPKERLEAIPETIYTLAELERRQSKS
jgi:DnaK suppressor protein